MQEFPKWRYGKDGQALIVNDPEHENAVAHDDDGFVNHPDQLAAAEPSPVEPEPKKPTRKR